MSTGTGAAICPLCGDCYQESSEENANRPDRMCSRCWTAQAKVVEASREPFTFEALRRLDEALAELDKEMGK